jgi:hypothetical protein
VNESKLIGFAKKYRIVLLCGIGNPRVDPFEDTLITLSSAFRITGATDQTIDAPIGKISEAIDKMPLGIGTGMWHGLALLPISVDVSEIKKASDIEKRGGILITDPKVGGYQQGVGKPIIPPPNIAPITT